MPSVLAWLGEPPDSEDPEAGAAQAALLAVRPYIRKISSGSLVDDLATGELCVIIASNGDAMQAQERTRIARQRRCEIRYSIPKEGAVMWFDVAAIPTDAPHPDNAHRLHRLPHGSRRLPPRTAMPSTSRTATPPRKPCCNRS